MKKIVVSHLFPEVLNLYGDSGNMLVLSSRLKWRGHDCEIREVCLDDKLSLFDTDILFLGGGSDREQKIVCDTLQKYKNEIKAYVDAGGVLLAVCGGYQLLGHEYAMGDEVVSGLSICDFVTVRSHERLIGNIVIKTNMCTQPIVGYENHAGRTILPNTVQPFGKVLSGFGNDGISGFEGVWQHNVVGTYIHGPVLPKNPEFADALLLTALQNKYGVTELEPLDDAVENKANEVMCARLLK